MSPLIRLAFAFVLGASFSASAQPMSTGTGFAVAGGSVVVTNAHVVDGCGRIEIGGWGPATVRDRDRRVDLALLTPMKPLSAYLAFRGGRGVRLGDEIVVVGYPLRGVLASGAQATTGIVSALAGIGDDRTRLQITAPVQPGNSGGPVLDRSGNVIGVVVSKLDAVKAAMVTGDLPQNVNFAVQGGVATTYLDSLAVDYQVEPTGVDRPVVDVVSRAMPATVLIECHPQAAAPSAAQAAMQSQIKPPAAPVTVVERFYAALNRADGDAAARLVIPSKRERGPFSAGEITRFYASLRSPLRLVEALDAGAGVVDVRYEYVGPSGKTCAGRATVTTRRIGDETLIERIQSAGC